MAGNIKGITIEFRGETTKLQKALKSVNSETAKLDKELQKVDKALKFNPTNVDLWRQKQTLLTQKISQTEDKLSALKQQQKQMDAKGVDKNSEEYRKLSREIIETESKLKTFKAQLRGIGNVKLRAIGESFQKAGKDIEAVGNKMRGLSMVAAGVATSVGAVTVKTAKWADDINTLSKVTGISTKQLQQYKATADLVDVSTEAIAKANVKLKKTMYSAADGKSGADAFAQLGVAVTDAEGNLRDSNVVFSEVLKSLGSMTNETERDALAMQLMGKSASELNPLIEDGGKTYEEVAATMQKYGLDFIDEKSLQKANEFNDKLDTIKMIGSLTFQQLGVNLAEYLAPAMEKVVEKVGQLAKWLSGLSPVTLTIITAIAGLLAVLAPIIITIGKLSSGIGAIIKLVGVIGPMMGGFAATILPVIAVIGVLVAAGILLYKNWDTIKAKALAFKENLIATFNNIKAKVSATFTAIKNAITTPIAAAINKVKSLINGLKSTLSGAWSSIKSAASSAWNAVKSAIQKPMQAAKNTVKGIVDKIKSFFPFNVGKILNLKIPKIKIDGGKAPWGIGGKGKAPNIDVSWHAKGAIFRQPTLLAGADGRVHGVGEAGAEALLPLERLFSEMNGMFNSMADNIVNGVIMANRMQAAAAGGGEIHLDVYLFPNGPKMREEIVKAYDQGKKILG